MDVASLDCKRSWTESNAKSWKKDDIDVESYKTEKRMCTKFKCVKDASSCCCAVRVFVTNRDGQRAVGLVLDRQRLNESMDTRIVLNDSKLSRLSTKVQRCLR
mmetsp:Transcript_9160/g.14082  ORF Transcript_9160/g.14082 Transcript_9160/m.14082 type:complete len:103 (-) Transcript_9160:11-319(-)